MDAGRELCSATFNSERRSVILVEGGQEVSVLRRLLHRALSTSLRQDGPG